MPSAEASPTIADVARRAGVHAATVSRTLHRPDLVASATRAKVLAAVEAIGYVPDPSAQRLAGGRTEAVGVIVPDIANPYFATILQAIQSASAARGSVVLIADSGGDPTTETRMLESLNRRVDGVVVCTPVTDLAAATVPVVQVNRQSRAISSVVVDPDAIVNAAVDHLVGLGHTRIAYLHGPSRYWSTRRRDHAVARLAHDDPGCRDGRGPSIGARADLVGVRPGSATFDGGRQAVAGVLATAATGVIAFNDLQAAGLLAGLDEAGVAVPEQISVVGSDGLDLARMTTPSLTTVAAPLADIGHRALELLFTTTGVRRVTLQPRLVPGRSSGPSPSVPNRSTHDRSPHAHTG